MTAALFTVGGLAAIAAIGLGIGWLVWQSRQPGRIRRADRTGAGPGWSPAAEVGAQTASTELTVVQTKAEQAAEQQAIAKPIDDNANRIIDEALAAIRAACDRGRDAILAGDEHADTRAYYLRADLHRSTGDTNTDTGHLDGRSIALLLARDEKLARYATTGLRGWRTRRTPRLAGAR